MRPFLEPAAEAQRQKGDDRQEHRNFKPIGCDSYADQTRRPDTRRRSGAGDTLPLLLSIAPPPMNPMPVISP